MSTSNLSDKFLVESDPYASTLFTSTSTTLTTLNIVYEEEWELMFHTWIWVQKIPLHLIVDNGSQKNFVSEYLVKRLGLVTTPHPHPCNIGWMKDGQKLRITWQCRLTYFINPFEDEVLCDVEPFSIDDALFGKPYLWDQHGIYHSWPYKVIVKIQNQ